MAAIDSVWRVVILIVAGIAGGIANGVAGGGTFITFPTLLALGIPSLQANVTSTVGILPSVLAGVGVFRKELRVHRATLRRLVPVSVVGSGIGTALLLTGSEQTFRSVVPWLIGAGTLLFALAPSITRLLARRRPEGIDAQEHPRALAIGILLASIYGGYFGAGLGIVLLAVLALSLPDDIFALQGLRIALALVANSVAALVFVIRGHLALIAVAILLVSTLIGGWMGAKMMRRLPPVAVRSIVIAIGAVTTVRLAMG
jgi:hypothetical protein